MIFVTVGAQMSFTRLLTSVDNWASTRVRHEVFAQIGPTDAPPRHLAWTRLLSPQDFRSHVTRATVLVGHAGMGTILTALQHAKPVLVMPRRGDLHETRNDHQIATARRFAGRPGIHVAMDEHELLEKLDRIDELVAGPPISAHASPQLIEAVRAFIHDGRIPERPTEPPVVVTRPALEPTRQPT